MIEDLLAPLAPREPTDAEITALLKRADRRKRRRRAQLALTAAAATAAIVAVTQQRTPVVTAASIIKTAAATAAEQPAPAPWTGYRYVKSLDTRTTAGFTVQRTEEEWVDSSWQGRLTSTPRLVSGTIPDLPLPPAVRARLTPEQRERYDSQPHPAVSLKPYTIDTPKQMPNLYGDGPLAKVPLPELPTDPQKLAALLLAAHKDGRWTPSGAWNPPPQVQADVLRDVLLLLTLANASPGQRAALISVLANYENATALPSATDHQGRSGRGVQIGNTTVIFSPETSELLEWSQPGEIHTFLTTGQVSSLGDRP